MILYSSIGILLLTLVVAVCIFFYPFGIRTKEIDVSEVTNAREDAKVMYQQARKDRVALLAKNGIIANSEPSYSASVDMCSLIGVGSGWSISSWNQTCSIRDTDLYKVNLTSAEITARFSHKLNVAQKFGASKSLYGECGILYQKNDVTLSYMNFSSDNKNRCRIFDYAHMSSTPDTKTRVIRSFNLNSIDKSKTYLMVESNYIYFKKDIGCKSGIKLGCNAPIATPVTDF